MNLEEARAWTTSPPVVREMSQMDDEAEAAIDTMDRTLSRMRVYSSATQGEYRRAGNTVNTSQGAFNTEINVLSLGRARDGRAAFAAYRAFVAALRAMQGLNARNAAMVEADVAGFLERLFVAGAAMQSAQIRRETRAMRSDLLRLRDRLRRARREALGAEAQRAINLVLGGIGLVLGLMTGVDEAAAAFAVGSAVMSTALDMALGPGSPDAVGGANTGVGLVTGLSRDIPSGVSNFTGVCNTFIGFLADNEEVATASRNLAGADRDLERAITMFRDYGRHVASAASQVTIAKRLAEGAIRDARARTRTYRESAAAYRELERGLTELRSGI